MCARTTPKMTPPAKLLCESEIMNAVRTNLIARVSRIQGHEIRIVLYARLDDGDCRFY